VLIKAQAKGHTPIFNPTTKVNITSMTDNRPSYSTAQRSGVSKLNKIKESIH